MAAQEPIGFSPDGEYLAQCSFDGRLKVWETATNSLKQEYTPSSHLETTCCCLSWGPAKRKSHSTRKKKKIKTDGLNSTGELEIIALGTLSGSILLYSVVKGELQSQMVNGHVSKVNSICWNTESNLIYSASDDEHIIEWNVQNGSIKKKWKAGQDRVQSLCISPDGTTLLSANRNILWWDLSNYTIIKKFTGHASEIRQMLFVSYPNSSDSNYIISSAIGDRLLHAWHLDKESKDQKALAAFTLPEESVFIDITRPEIREQSLLLTAITRNGLLVVFEHHLNGRRKKPLKPALTVSVATSDVVNDEIPKPIPIVCAQLCNDDKRNIFIAYGNEVKLSFEQIPYSSAEKEICLPRKDPSKFTINLESSTTKIKQPHKTSGGTILVPGHMLPAMPTADDSKKRKREILVTNQLPMEERLSVLTLDQSTQSNVPRVLNQSHLLVQGLQSNDPEILSNVLLQSEDDVIASTVPRLPVQAIIPLLTELQKRVHNNKHLNRSYLKWIRCILSIHTSYLLACRDIEALLGSLYQLLDARTQMFEKMSRLKGRMNLILTQLKSKKSNEFGQIQPDALLVYEDDSSDDEINHSDSSMDNWEDLSNDEDEDEDVDDEIEMDSEQSETDKLNTENDSVIDSEELGEDCE